MQTSSSPSVSILPHSLVTRYTVRTSFLTIKSGRIFTSTPSRLWTRSSPWTTSCSASRKHQIWRSSSEVNGRREDNVLRDNPHQRRPQEVLRREVGARRQLCSARRASPRLDLRWSPTARRRIIHGVFEPTLICIQYLQFNSASTTTPA